MALADDSRQPLPSGIFRPAGADLFMEEQTDTGKWDLGSGGGLVAWQEGRIICE
jgi:hypothetical protein